MSELDYFPLDIFEFLSEVSQLLRFLPALHLKFFYLVLEVHVLEFYLLELLTHAFCVNSATLGRHARVITELLLLSERHSLVLLVELLQVLVPQR